MLKIKNLNVTVQKKQILKNINLELGNKLIGITGANGSGKSTLCKSIAGLIKHDGEIILGGKDITKLDTVGRAKEGVSFAFQNPVKFKGLTVKDLIELAGQSNIDRCSLCGVLSKVGLCAREYMDRELDNTLSGGELKRIELASVLAKASKLIIFDEPEAGVDLWSFDNLLEIFNGIKSLNIPIMIVSHQEKLLKACDEIILLESGEVKNIMSPEKFFQDKQKEEKGDL